MKLITCASFFFATLSAIPAEAKQVCGWYAIASCTASHGDASAFMSRGWGYVINTTDFPGLKPGYFCVVSGPQSKSSAARNVRTAAANGVADGMYIKRACVDDSRFAE
jgi:hypothetical protein